MASDSAKVVVFVRDGVVTGVRASDPNTSVRVLDFDSVDESSMSDEDRATLEDAEHLHGVYWSLRRSNRACWGGYEILNNN